MATRTRTFRGIVAAGAIKRLIADDGQYQNGLKIKSLAVWSPTATNDGYVILSRNETLATEMRPDDGSQIAWGLFQVSTANAVQAYAWIDPDHIIQQDLFISGVNGLMAYLIEAEEVNMTEAQGVLQLVKTSTLND